MSFGILSQVDQRNHILDGGRYPSCKGVILRGRACPHNGPHCRQHCGVNCAKRLNRSRCRLGYELGGPKEACIRWGPDSSCEWAIIRGIDIPGYVIWHSAVSCAKIAELINLAFGYVLGWAEGSTSFNRVCQCALMGGHIGATWQMQLNRPSAAAMRPYVQLLWPLIIIIMHYNYHAHGCTHTVF